MHWAAVVAIGNGKGQLKIFYVLNIGKRPKKMMRMMMMMMVEEDGEKKKKTVAQLHVCDRQVESNRID